MKTKIIAAVPASGWIIERMESDGVTKTMLPLAAWGITDDGEVVPLPLSLGKEWTCRPAGESDPATIRRTSQRLMQHPASAPWGATFFDGSHWVEDAT
jgi:hypothetical protein